ncbi:e3 ubiquitin ligase complex slx8-rfp subunit slx8 [Fusarium pseudoanthophilum]|uniref:E3 ubiquitin ligase complex slx8-rfp subunit slx8 n=1 Tax=Fusarium pseudoanthophilum TaxID=48495 RepID=A0A8H5Q5J2_9HYPO|nr:e3 ubiquitin ligase complex slx8-rfp subunit slx8 [Fusarium pseudoanthophilum]
MSTTTRIVSPPDFAGAGAPHSNTQPRSRAQRTVDLEIDGISASASGSTNASGSSGNSNSSSGGGGASRSHIRQTTTSSSLPLTYLSLPPLISNSRLRTFRTPSPLLTTTQRPRPSHSPPPQSIQTSLWGEPASASSTHFELPPIGSWENDHSESLHNADLENSLLASEIEDDFLADLADGDFSSPSSYPPFTNTDSRPSQSHSVSLHSTVQAPTPHRAFRNTTASANAITNTTARELSSTNCILHPFGPERTTTQLSSASNSTGESQASLPVFDSLEENDFFFDSPASSFSEAMPPATRRSTTAAAARTSSVHASKRRRTSTTAAPAGPPQPRARPTSRQRKSPATSKDMNAELFGTSPTRSPIDVEAKAEFDTIDLTETNEVFEEARKPEKDDRVKLAAFQCVICMDDCSNLTVTHCGHLYCASCLHQSLNVDVTKGKCPMCRQRLDLKPRESYNSKTKGYWPLELKLMTATRKGKRKANTLS